MKKIFVAILNFILNRFDDYNFDFKKNNGL